MGKRRLATVTLVLEEEASGREYTLVDVAHHVQNAMNDYRNGTHGLQYSKARVIDCRLNQNDK